MTPILLHGTQYFLKFPPVLLVATNTIDSQSERFSFFFETLRAIFVCIRGSNGPAKPLFLISSLFFIIDFEGAFFFATTGNKILLFLLLQFSIYLSKQLVASSGSWCTFLFTISFPSIVGWAPPTSGLKNFVSLALHQNPIFFVVVLLLKLEQIQWSSLIFVCFFKFLPSKVHRCPKNVSTLTDTSTLNTHRSWISRL